MEEIVSFDSSSLPTSPYHFSTYEFPSGTKSSDTNTVAQPPPCPLSEAPPFLVQEQKHNLPSIKTHGSVPTPECSPTTSVTEVSSPRTPHSHTSSVASAPSSAYAPSTTCGGHGTEVPSIRAAYKISVRKKKSFHRNSWTPSLTVGAATPVPAVPPVPMTTGLARSPLVSSGLSKPPDVAGCSGA